MLLNKVTAIGPSGAMVTFEPTGEGALLLDPREGFMLIRDTGLPLHTAGEVPAGTPPSPRVVGQIPSTWAFTYEWAQDEAPQQRADSTDLRAANGLNGSRHSGAVIPDDSCACSECEEARMRRRTAGAGKAPTRTQ
jgi:hypothetical protein